MKTKIRWGVIGSGGIARRRTIPEGIARADNAELVAVYDTDPERNREVAAQFGALAAGTVEELLGAGVDAAYIASPPGAHREQAVACARAGVDVLCEKPLGMTVEDAGAMADAFRDLGRVLGTAFMMRFHAQHREALRLVREGRLGTPVLGRAQLSCWYPPMPGAWRQDPATGGGGSLIDMGGHCADLLEMFFGPARRVSCLVNRSVHAYASEDSAVATIQFDGGAIGVVDAFFCIPDESSQNRLELYGSKGSILARGTIGQGERGEMRVFAQADAGGYDAGQARGGEAGEVIDPPAVNMYRAEIEEFGRALLEGRAPAVGADVGLRSQRLMAACYESARTGRVVELA